MEYRLAATINHFTGKITWARKPNRKTREAALKFARKLLKRRPALEKDPA